MGQQQPIPRPDEGGDIPSADTDLRVLFDVGHPAQVHLFRNAIEQLEARGQHTFVTAREKDVTLDLLEAYGIAYRSLSTRGDSMPALLVEALTREVRLLSVARRFRPDVIVSRLSPVPAHVSALTGCEYVAVSDTHIDNWLIRRCYHGVTLPFVDRLCVPDTFQLPIAAEKRRSLDFQELAYLHPKYFRPNPDILTAYGIDPEADYTVLRVAGWDAYHDVGNSGLSLGAIRRLVALLEDYGEIFISAENELPPDLERYQLRIDPEDIHHLLACADLYVGDSGTMSSEAAMLGTPAIRATTIAGPDDENVFRALEDRYGLLRSYADEERAIRAVDDLLACGVNSVNWEERRERLLAEQPDVTARIVTSILECAPLGGRRVRAQ